MNRTTVSLMLLVVVASAAVQAQDPFDLDAYQAHLATTEAMDASSLLSQYEIGAFEARADGQFSVSKFASELNTLFELTADEKSLVDRHGFMVTERLKPESFGAAFVDIFKKDMPVFLSTDAILHAFHMSYSSILQDTEEAFLIPNLSALLEDLRGGLNDMDATYQTNTDMARPIREVDQYLTVAASLLAGDEESVRPVFSENADVIDDLLALVAAENPTEYALWTDDCRIIDFSQFTPRGHYTNSLALTRYFQAMIWLGRSELYLVAPKTQRCAPSEDDVQRQSIMANLLFELVGQTGSEGTYNDIETAIQLFVGEQDNVTLNNLSLLRDKSGMASAADLTDDSTFEAYQGTLASEGFSFQRINSQILYARPLHPEDIQPATAFLLFGQRFVIDSFASAKVVFAEIEQRRMLPSTQDVLFALGNDASAQFLQQDLEQFGYARNLDAVRYLTDSYEPEFWNSTLYNGWLQAIRTLNPPKDRTNLPPFMQTAAWWQEKMNTQLAGWAQLRHDNLLYAKQSYSGAVACEYPFSYVEPIPAFYEAMGTLSRRFSEVYRQIVPADDWRANSVSSHFDFWSGVSDTLSAIATKELDGTSFTDEESSFLRRMIRTTPNCGPELIDGWYAKLFYRDPERAKKVDLVVADIHTAPTDAAGNPVGWVLHAGTGPLNMAVVTTEVPGAGRVAFVGPVMSYYEHLSTGFDRLTDERWAEAYADPASYRPEFTKLYLADDQGRAQQAELRLAVANEPDGPNQTAAAALHLDQNFPNPFRENTTVSYTISPANGFSNVSLKVFDMQGRLVHTLVDEMSRPGRYTVRWDGDLDSGRKLASGTYVAKLVVGEANTSRLLTIVK